METVEFPISGYFKRVIDEEESVFAGLKSLMRSIEYDYWWRVLMLCLSITILKLILAQIRSQCSAARTGWMWLTYTHARQSWRHCNLSRFDADLQLEAHCSSPAWS